MVQVDMLDRKNKMMVFVLHAGGLRFEFFLSVIENQNNGAGHFFIFLPLFTYLVFLNEVADGLGSAGEFFFGGKTVQLFQEIIFQRNSKERALLLRKTDGNL